MEQPLKILFVINDLYTHGNGLAASARRTIALLREHGHHVRVLSALPRDGDDCGVGMPEYVLPPLRIPLVDPLIASQGYAFARAKRREIERALAWADVVHLEEPFMLQAVVARRARARGVPALATYHIHPENLTASVYLDRCALLNRVILELWKRAIFNRSDLVQCPSRSVYERVLKLCVRAPLLLLSNGVPLGEEMSGGGHEVGESSVVRILVVGRFSREKDQATILRALRHSAHARSIQLSFAGRGPTERSLRASARRLLRRGVIAHPVRFAFMNADELAREASSCDLYVHAARIEVEGLSALEVLRHGVMPIIARGPLTATSQFALSEDSVFEVGDARALARAIDVWIDRGPVGRQCEARRYRCVGERYDIRACVARLEEAYHRLVFEGRARG
ncbi:glycosyltransferase, group 1 family protein [Actinomyces sp. ICM58]|uniref:glycosyltransferase n=1 Tax=Actinomyces sp. ICM58 TaxID=1105030 RepID=UPI00027720C6|nr:glycosyltransferase [Actinomyces sp. ICM58]EJN52377.1 glycosyltransferase, group 1 family protein [Actinomyces sp. ICM58]